MNTKVLQIRLEGPLQSWGDRSRFLVKETNWFPTKSGVTGLLFCAMGLSGAQEAKLAQLADLRMSVISYSIGRSRPSILEDFQMVGNGYDDANPWENLLIPKTIEGKKPVGSGAKLTYRSYLQDAHFEVFFEIPNDWAMFVEEGLKNPKWDIYLGRKSCAPTSPVFQGIFDNFEEAEKAFIAQNRNSEIKLIEKIIDTNESGIDVESVYDVPIRFGRNKKYRERMIKRVVYVSSQK